MKKYLFTLMLIAQGAHAMSMVATCQGEDFYVRTIADVKGKEPLYVEIYTQAGSGPNNLESSYVAIKSKFKTSPDNVKMEAELPMDGQISIHNKEGAIRFPGVDAAKYPLTDCKYSVN
ncbi:MAG: hypothetical protein ACOYL6_09855 [Bacteriovoracaceae bacterium]